MKNTSIHSKKAFTLIELLVVIAIIAILAAILFPVFGRARENARRSTCQSNLKNIGLGIAQYTQDYDETFPLPDVYSISGSNRSYDNILSPYIGARIGASGFDPASIWACPNDTAPRSPSGGVIRTARSYPLVRGRKNGSTDPCSLETTSNITGFCGAGANRVNGITVARSLSEITAPAATFYIAERHDPTSNVGGGTTIVDYPLWNGNGGGQRDAQAGVWADATSFTNFIELPPEKWAHFEGFNYLYCDGHVKWLKPGSTLGRNPDGTPGTRARPRGGWTVFDGDDQ